MQELVLIQPGRTAEEEFAQEAAAAVLRRANSRSAACGVMRALLAYRVGARRAAENSADAEDVAQASAASRVPAL